MKKLIYIFFITFCLHVTGHAQDKFRVVGALGGSLQGKLLLMEHSAKGIKQLDEALMVNGSFEFTGNVPEPVVAYVMTEEKQLVATLMLENLNYTLIAGTLGIDVEGGGENQKIWNLFDAVNKKLAREQMMAQQEMQAAYAQRNQAKAVLINEKFTKVVQETDKEEWELVKNHGNSFVAAYVVASKTDRLSPEDLSEWYGLLGVEAKQSFFGQYIKKEVDRYQRVAVGAIAPDFKASLSNGGELSLHETRAKVKVIDFWASWCAPCRQENKNLPKLYKKYREEGLEIISVSLDTDEATWLKAIQEDRMTWKNVSDLQGGGGGLAKLYLVKNIPHVLLLDEENRIVAKNLRGAALQKKIAELLGKK